jgi:hypothetical protein
MFLAICAILFVMWLLGFVVFPVAAAGGLIHLLLLLAVISLILHLMRGTRAV